MKKQWPIAFLLLFGAFLSGVSARAETPRQFPQGAKKALIESLADLSSFPAGTRDIMLEHHVREKGQFYSVNWTFEQEKPEGLMFPQCFVMKWSGFDEEDKPPHLAAKSPGMGLAASLKAYLQALDAGEKDRLRPFITKDMTDDDLEYLVEYKVMLVEALGKGHGYDLDRIIRECFPKPGASPALGGAMISWHWTVTSGEKIGVMHVEGSLVTESDEEANWKIENASAGFLFPEEPIAKLHSTSPVALKGLRAHVLALDPPDIGGIPGSARHVMLMCTQKHGDHWIDSDITLDRDERNQHLILSNYSVMASEAPEGGAPAGNAREGALTALKTYLKAVLAGDVATVKKYIPKDFAFMADEEMLKHSAAEFATKAKAIGETPASFIDNRLPSTLTLPARSGTASLNMAFPATHEGKDGAWHIMVSWTRAGEAWTVPMWSFDFMQDEDFGEEEEEED